MDNKEIAVRLTTAAIEKGFITLPVHLTTVGELIDGTSSLVVEYYHKILAALEAQK